MDREQGFSLVELIIVLAIIAITLNVALPPFKSAVDRGRLAEAVSLFVGALHYARDSAVIGRELVSVCAGQVSCTGSQNWQSDLLIFNDQNKNGQFDNNETLLRKIATPPDFSVHWSNFRNASYLQYESDGTTRALNGTFTLCHENQPRMQVVINLTGRVRTQAPGASAKCS